MHFIGMNAADLGIPVAYDPVLHDHLADPVDSRAGRRLFIVGRSDGGPINLLWAACSRGSGVALMHYTGMAAMIMPAQDQLRLSCSRLPS